MRKLFFFTFLALVSCQSNEAGDHQNVPKNLKSLHREVLAIHDEVMPKMGAMGKLISALEPKVDTTVVGKQYKVAKDDLGKVIGKQGRTARAMRTILGAASTKIKKRSVLEILE